MTRWQRCWPPGFAEDPWFGWLWPGDSYDPCAPDWFPLVAGVARPKGHCYVAGDRLAAALWVPPGEVLATADDLAAAAALLQTQVGDRAAEVLAALGASAAAEPPEPHFACTYVAVRPDVRGRGYGAAVMRPVLNACDVGGFPAYLVSTNERNLGFYRRLGFKVIAELPVAGGAVTFRPMLRRP
ncbi:MAG: GNAT family N-acetyltransferase [Acidimicrobiia bacterium]